MRLPFPSPLVPAVFLERPNRFVVRARLVDGSEQMGHLPDPGCLKDLLAPGVKLWLASAPAAATRKTRYDVLLAETPAGLISLDTRIPTQLVRRALEQQSIPEFAGYSAVRPETRFGRSRIDFLLSAASQPDLLLEVKSVTLVEDNVGLFPDAVTERGTRHMKALAEARRQAFQAAVLFIVQRDDANAVAPRAVNDPAFARSLRQAAAVGVRLVAYTCCLTLQDIALANPVPVRLEL